MPLGNPECSSKRRVGIVGEESSAGGRESQHDRDLMTPQTAAGNAELLRQFVDAVREYAIFMLDPTGTVETWNRGAARIKGYSAEEIVGQHFSVFYLPEDVNAGKPQRELSQAAAEGQIRDEGWRVRKDGSRFWANVVITAVRDEDGALKGFAKITRDDTDRRQAEEQVRVLELLSERERIATHLLDTVVHQIFAAGLTVSSSLQYIQNPAATRRVQDAVEILDATLRDIRTFVISIDTDR